VYQAGKLLLTANTTDITFSSNNKSITVGTNLPEAGGFNIGDILFTYSDETPPNNFLETGVVLEKITYNDLYTVLGGAELGLQWSNRITANTNQQTGVTYGNGVFVAVGGGGSIQTSTNGTTWTNRTTANTSTQNGVAYGNGVFVSVGESGGSDGGTIQSLNFNFDLSTQFKVPQANFGPFSTTYLRYQ